LLRSAVGFYLRGGQAQQAEAALRRLARSQREEPAAWARRTLAVLLAASGDYRRSNEALKLLDENAALHNDPQDERARALVLGTRPGERQRSIRTLEESFTRL